MTEISQQELAELFGSEETDRFERTESVRNGDKIGKTICAFANDLPNHGKPGVLFIGQKDDRTCAGLTVDDQLLLNIAAYRSAGNILPQPVMTVQKHNINGCDLCVVTVTPSQSPPVRYKGECWVRVGARLGHASPEDERVLTEKQRMSGTYIAQKATYLGETQLVDINELNLDYFENTYLPAAISRETLAKNHRDFEHQLRALRFLSSRGHPNNAAVLCLHDEPHLFISESYVQFIRIRGTEITDIVATHEQFTGNIFTQMRLMDEMFKVNINTAPDFSGNRRVDVLDYPVVALQEILRNAIIHRNYDHASMPVKCLWFDDRVEIHSPGGLYGLVTPKNFGSALGITAYRNDILAEAARNMGYAERFGAGIQRAQDAMRKNGNPAIEFTVESGYISATLKPVAKSATS